MGYVALEPMLMQTGEGLWEADRTPVAVTHEPYPISFQQDYPAPPVFLAQRNSLFGTDPSSIRYQELSASSASVFVQEERSKDREMIHVSEEVSYLAVYPPGPILRAENASASEIQFTGHSLVVVQEKAMDLKSVRSSIKGVLRDRRWDVGILTSGDASIDERGWNVVDGRLINHVGGQHRLEDMVDFIYLCAFQRVE